MTSNWSTVSLAAVSGKPQYGVIASGSDTPIGPLLVRQTDITSGRVDWSSVPYCDLSSSDIAKYALRQGDLLISRLGNGVGNAATILEARDDAVFAGYLVRFQPDPEVANPVFVGYQLQSNAWRAHVSSFRSGAAQPTLNAQQMGEFEFLLPPLEEQRAIAATLGALDDKVESNRRATAVGESLIRALVESALDASEGADGTLGDYCRLVKAPVKVEEISADDNYIGLEHMPRGSIFLTEWEKAEGLGSNKTAFQRGDVLFGKLRPYFKKVGIAPVNGVCSTDILAVRPKDPRDLALIAVVAASDALIDSLSAGSTGTRMPRASWKDLAAWQVPVLTLTERAELSDRVAPLIDRLEQLTFESRRLTALRDALLPELLSGRIRVPAEGVAA